MQSRMWMLVRHLLKASSNFNILKYEQEKKKRNKIIGGFTGSAIMYVFFAVMLFMLSTGLGAIGMSDGVPGLCALFISLMELLFGIFRVGGYLFSRKDYEILTALPFTIREQVSARFLAMYIRNLPATFIFSIAMMAGYGSFARPAFYVYLIWILLTIFLPLIPTVAAAIIGVLSAGISAGSKHKTVLQSAFIFIFTIACFVIGQVGGRLFSSTEQTNATLTTISNAGQTAGQGYFPIRWFSDAITRTDPISILLLIVVSIGIFQLTFFLVSKFFRKINSRMFSVPADNKIFKMEQQKQQKTRSVIDAISFKEFRHMMGSAVYLTNIGVGLIIVLILSVVVLFVDINWLFSMITRDAPIMVDIITPAIPLILFFFVGMVPTTAVSWSLEGKNFWILESLPLTKFQICRGKMRFNLKLFLPFMIFGCISFGIALKIDPLTLLVYLSSGIMMCLYSTTYGMYCNLKHINMDWDKEAEVLKQGSSVMFYLFPNLFSTMFAAVGAVMLGREIGAVPLLLLATAAYGAVAFLFYKLVKANCMG